MRFEQLLEAKNVYDFRHEDISAELSIWPKQAQGSYVDPRDGFYWNFSKGNLLIFSTENEFYSFVANMFQNANDEEKAIAKSDVRQFIKIPRILNAHRALTNTWNQLSGVVIFSTMTLTILKESSKGDTMRQRVIADIATFKQALGSLKSFGVTDEIGQIFVGLVPRGERDKSSHEILSLMRQAVIKIPGIFVSIFFLRSDLRRAIK